MDRASSPPAAESDLPAEYRAIRREAMLLGGGPGDIPPRVALLHSIFLDSQGNHAFPEVALHGALWAFGFYERRGAVSRMISYRYFYDSEERASRAYMLFEFSQGFKEANRSVFVDTPLLEALNRVHHAARAGRRLSRRERSEVFETSLRFEQEATVGPKVREEVTKFECPILTAIVLRPVVRFSYFPRLTFMRFRDFGNTDERIEKAVISYDLAEQAGWDSVADRIRLYGLLPPRFFGDPPAYAAALRSAAG